MRAERAPRRAKMDPKNIQRVPKLPLGDKQYILMIFGNFLVSFWSRFGPQAAIMRPERAPRREQMDPKNSQGVPK